MATHRIEKPFPANLRNLSILRDYPNPSVNILAVHGLAADPVQTWVTKEGKWNWLDNQLVNLIPEARVWTFGYNSRWVGNQSVDVRLNEVASKLLDAIDSNDLSGTPLIFVAHSFGGIVVSKALLMAENPDNEWSMPGKAFNLFQHTVAVLFFGTPFRGTHEWFQKDLPILAKDLVGHVEKTIFETFRQGSETLDQLRKDLLEKLHRYRRPNVGCFQELQVSNVGKIVGREEIPKVLLVQRSDAILEGSSRGEPQFLVRALERNHFNLHNFESNDPAFATVEFVLKKVVPDILLSSPLQYTPDPLTPTDEEFGVMSSVISCIEVGFEIADRLDSYLAKINAPPQVFVTLCDTIPLLITTFQQVKDACDNGGLSLELQSRLTKTVEGCHRLITALEHNLQRCLPAEGDSSADNAMKDVQPKRSVKAIEDIQRNLETYKSTLNLYFSRFAPISKADYSLKYAPEESRYFEVPAMNVQYFVGRNPLIERIDGCLQKVDITDDNIKIVVLHGIGGQGKTQLALEYCRRQRRSHSIFWFDATSSATAFRSFENVASKFAPGVKFPTRESARAYVLKAFKSFKDPLLLIFDTFDKPDEFAIKEFFPLDAKIIITSRRNDLMRLGSSVEVGELTDDEGVELLFHQAGLEKTRENREHARVITQELGGLALAIDQAATYINVRKVPLDLFPNVYKKRRAAILRHTPAQWEYRRVQNNETEKSVSVFTTWEMSFEQLETTGQERDSIIHLLTLAAFIDTNRVSEGLFSLYSQQPNRPGWLDAFMNDETWDSDKYQDYVVLLHSISLVTSMDLEMKEARISFHPVVAEWLKYRIDQVARAQYLEEAIRLVQLFIDNGDKKEMSPQDRREILGHLDQIIEHDDRFSTDGEHMSQALKQATVSFGSFYRRLGHYDETEVLIKRTIANKNVSPAEKNVLANMYCDQGLLEEAKKLYGQVLTFFGHSLPEEAVDEKLDVTRFKFMYWTQDDKLTADGLAYVEDPTKDLHRFYPWFVSLLSAFNGLGVLFMQMGRLITAEKLLQQALEGREKIGVNTSPTAIVHLHLGILYARNGQYDKAEGFLCRAVDCLETVMSPQYMMTQLATHNLGILRLLQNRLSDAEEIFLRTTKWVESSLGPAHVLTLSMIHNQALLFREQGKIIEAQKLLEKTIEGWRESAATASTAESEPEPGAESRSKSRQIVKPENDFRSKSRQVAKPEADSIYCLAELYQTLALADDVDGKGKEEKAESLFREAAALY